MTLANKNNPSVHILVLITTDKSAVKARDVFKKAGFPIQYGFLAEGTASSEILDMLGLGSTEKRVLISMLKKEYAGIMLEKLHRELEMHKLDSGIAFTVSLTGANNLFLRMVTNDDEISEEIKKLTQKGDVVMNNGREYSLIAAVVDRGFANDVMISAREAGAGGGTVVHSRQLINEQTAGFWGISMQEEKDILLIISKHEDKVNIMKAISEKYGMQSEAKGVVLSLPIDSVMGL